MLTVENSGAALIGGRPPHQGETVMKTEKVKVLRAFWHDRKLRKKDEVHEFPAYWAAEYCACGKAEPVAEEPPAKLAASETDKTQDDGLFKGKGQGKDKGDK